MKTKFFISFILIFFMIQLNLFSKETTLKIPIVPWAPFITIDENNINGIDIDLLTEIEKRTNLKFNYLKYPWARSLLYMKNGNVDLISSLAKREDRKEYILYTSIPYYTCSTVFYVHKGNKHLIKTYDDLKDHLIGYVDNSAYFPQFDKDSNLKKVAVANESRLIKMFAVGRIKIMIGTDCQVDYDIKQLGYSGMFEKTDFKPNNKVDLYIGISKNSANIVEFDKINSTIKDIINEGLVKKFAKKYYE